MHTCVAGLAVTFASYLIAGAHLPAPHASALRMHKNRSQWMCQRSRQQQRHWQRQRQAQAGGGWAVALCRAVASASSVPSSTGSYPWPATHLRAGPILAQAVASIARRAARVEIGAEAGIWASCMQAGASPRHAGNLVSAPGLVICRALAQTAHLHVTSASHLASHLAQASHSHQVHCVPCLKAEHSVVVRVAAHCTHGQSGRRCAGQQGCLLLSSVSMRRHDRPSSIQRLLAVMQPQAEQRVSWSMCASMAHRRAGPSLAVERESGLASFAAGSSGGGHQVSVENGAGWVRFSCWRSASCTRHACTWV